MAIKVSETHTHGDQQNCISCAVRDIAERLFPNGEFPEDGKAQADFAQSIFISLCAFVAQLPNESHRNTLRNYFVKDIDRTIAEIRTRIDEYRNRTVN